MASGHGRTSPSELDAQKQKSCLAEELHHRDREYEVEENPVLEMHRASLPSYVHPLPRFDASIQDVHSALGVKFGP